MAFRETSRTKKNQIVVITYNDNGTLAYKMLIDHSGLTQLGERHMRSFLINKNLSLYYWLKKKMGKKRALRVANAIEKTILIFGREIMPYFNRNGMLNNEQD